MKPKLLIASLSFVLATQVTAAQAIKVPYAPYADLTLNAYWDSSTQDMEPMDLAAVSQKTGIKNYRLAFLTDSGRCQAAWGGQSNYSVDRSWAKRLTDKMTQANINYDISFGGANGTDLSQNCDKNSLTSAYERVIQLYHPHGLDFDVENGTAQIEKILSALQVIQKKYPKVKLSFTLPVMPEGLVLQGQEIVRKAQKAGLNYTVNIMAMDYGSSYNGNMSQYAKQAATNLHLFLKQLYPGKSEQALWQMIEVTPMIGVNDVSVEQFTLDDATTLTAFAKEKSLNGISMWSIARDKPCADTWASPICSGKNLQSVPYEFSAKFLQ